MGEREAGRFLQENSEQDVIGTVGAEPLPASLLSGGASAVAEPSAVPVVLEQTIERLWQQSQASRFGISRSQFAGILLHAGDAQKWGGAEEAATAEGRAAFLQLLKVEELMLARACAAGNETAWELFLTSYREILYRAAYAIAREESAGRDLADSLYADLYGIGDGEIRRSRLDSFMGRGSLAGWLRSVLAQRFVDRYRKTRREESLDDQPAESLAAASLSEPEIAARQDLPLLARAVSRVLAAMEGEERFLLSSYYLDGRALWQIAKLLGVHESTISRRLDRLTRNLRKCLLKELERAGMSRRAAEEALDTDVRDIEVNVRILMQATQQSSFEEKRRKAEP